MDRDNREALVRDKYEGDRDADLSADLARLTKGEPLAYVIGWVPFLGLTIRLDSRPLIPRPETEWWTEKLINYLKERRGPVRVLDLCAGSGAIGLAILKHVPASTVSFGELYIQHAETVHRNLYLNQLPEERAVIRAGNLFEPFDGKRYNVIATNPPYIPKGRVLDASVTTYEPYEALFAGDDGLTLIRRILAEAPEHLEAGGELWMECDIENIEAARKLALTSGFARSEIQSDQYGRPRLLVSYL